MSVDQTYHTPSFGDEEFEIPPLSYAPTAAATRCSGQGVFGSQVPVEYLKRKLSCDQIYVYLPRQEENFTDCRVYNQHQQTLSSQFRPPESHPQQGVYQFSTPQGHPMNNNHFHNAPPHQQQQQQQQQARGPQDMYHNMMNSSQHSMAMQQQQMQYDNYSDTLQQQQQPMQMTLMHQQQQQQQNHVMGPPQPMFSTLNQSQMSNQLGLQMGQMHQGNSPPGSNNNSPRVESSEDSDDSTPLAQLIGTKKLTPEPVDPVPKVAKKPKAQKKKKKRDPNEPQKPVSAYALFFRDTQAAIKGQSPNASFGEVSKIVASMWDSLDADRKNSYKKKTETAKKEYLKALAAYRANLVSKAAVDQSDAMYGGSNSSPPSTHSPNSSIMSMQKQPVLTSVVDSMQPVTNNMSMHNQQVWHMQSPQHMPTTSPPHMMQSGNNMMNMQMQQMQQPPMSPQQQQMQVMNRSPVQQMPGNSPQQMCNSGNSPQMCNTGNSPQMCNSASNSPSYNQNMSTVNSGGNHANISNLDMMSSLPTCLRNGCSNPAIDSPDWDREYCSSECVVSHCKDVFATWVAQRQVPANPYSTVK